ncbi:MAG TPA: hypothetical protein VE076_06890 [Nitrososphaeraceae archaeon]|nr:hypothetical protein [Nitrososphaeraceae archaeon]
MNNTTKRQALSIMKEIGKKQISAKYEDPNVLMVEDQKHRHHMTSSADD